MSVSATDYSASGGRNGDKHLLVTVNLVDDSGQPVSGASVTVEIDLDGTSRGTASGTTGTDGSVTFTLNNAPSGTYTTAVIAVSAAGLTWDGSSPENSFTK